MKTITYLILILSLFSRFSNLLLAENSMSQVTEQLSQKPKELPSAPSTAPLPPNKRSPGGSLSPEQKTCQAKEGQLTVLIPESNDPHPPLTLSDPLTILVYFPDESSAIEQVEFWILSSDEKTQILDRVSLPVPNEPGIIAIPLPDELKTSLEVGQNYHWYMKVSCQNQTALAVNGWIQRVDNPQEDRWHDSLAEIAYQRTQNPDDPVIKSQWTSLLEKIDLSDLVEQPIYFNLSSG